MKFYPALSNILIQIDPPHSCSLLGLMSLEFKFFIYSQATQDAEFQKNYIQLLLIILCHDEAFIDLIRNNPIFSSNMVSLISNSDFVIAASSISILYTTLNDEKLRSEVLSTDLSFLVK